LGGQRSLKRFAIDNTTITSKLAHDMAHTANTHFSKKVRRMLGLSLDFWNNILVVFLGLGALAAIIVVVSTFIVIRLQRLEAADASLAFEQYKLGVSAQVADAKREGIEAGKMAGNAVLRAAELENEAANARLETEKIKGVVAWRVLSPETASKLEQVLATKPGSVNLRYTDGDPEALFLASQISQILNQAHWKLAPGALKLPNTIIVGFVLPDATGADAQTLRGAFSSAKVPFMTNPLPASGLGFSTSTIAGAPTLMVGSKAPPKLP
jgi:hypothetical protein